MRGFFNNGGTDERNFGELPCLPYYLESFFINFYGLFIVGTRDVSSVAWAYLTGLFQVGKQNVWQIFEKEIQVTYNQLIHFISKSPWSDGEVDRKIRKRASDLLGGKGTALMFDPTSVAKKGDDSVGVGRQYLGCLGKVDNGQVAVTSALVNGRDTCLIDKELALTKDWTSDEVRCDKAGIPKDRREYRTHQEIVKDMLERLDEEGIEYDWIGMDAEFGNNPMLFHLDDKGKTFLIDMKKNSKVFQSCPKLNSRPKSGKGRLKQLRYTALEVKLEDLVNEDAWEKIAVRASTKGMLTVEVQKRMVWLRDSNGKARSYHLIIRRQRGDKEVKIKYSLSNAPAKATLEELAFMQAQRFWVEQAIKDCKQQTGLNKYQVRQWNAWHHHFTMSILGSLFMMEMRLKFRDRLPLLTCSDIRTVLFHLLPRKADTEGGLVEVIQIRYKKREQALIQSYLE